jgi:hypothetical protein
MTKCCFAQPQLEYLGHIIFDKGVAIDLENTKAMLHWPVPANVTEIRGLLVLINYYRKFVKSYRVISKPLAVLLQKQNFEWNAKF